MSSLLFLNHFTVLDYAYLSADHGLLGESFYVSAELEGELDAQGFVMDFGRVKKLLKDQVDLLLDHRLVVPQNIAGLQYSQTSFRFESSAGLWEYSAPAQAMAYLNTKEHNPKDLEHYLETQIKALLPKNVSSLRFTLESESKFLKEDNFRYTHGLKYHDGNCQRLFHGHRNLIQVFESGQKSPEYEQELAEIFSDVHFVAADNIQDLQKLDLPLEERHFKHPGSAKIKYIAGQGEFSALVPANKLFILNSEPSIENIAQASKRLLEKRHPGKKFSVRAFEGLNKGSQAN